MKTSTAFFFRLLLPPLYATIILTATIGLTNAPRGFEFFGYFAFVAVFAYVIAGLPSLAFAILMGWFVRPSPAIVSRITGAAVLGLLAGILITVFFGLQGWQLFLPLGTFVGGAVEGTTLFLEHRKTAKAADGIS